LRDLSFADRVNRRLDLNQTGLMVENVEPAGWGALAGLLQGDLLLEVDKQPIGSIDDFKEIMKQLVSAREKRVLFFIRRGIHTLFLELEPDWDPQD
jgi:serine protease Do